MNLRPGVFFDRDGVINVPPPPEQRYITRPGDFRLMPGIAAAIRVFNEKQIPVAVVTNQKCVAMGIISEAELAAIHARMAELLAAEGARIDDLRYCPHAGDPPCACRKPKPGMLLAAAEALDIDLPRSWMVGDQFRDLQAGKAAGCRTVWVGEEAQACPEADFLLSSTAELPGWAENVSSEMVSYLQPPKNTPRF